MKTVWLKAWIQISWQWLIQQPTLNRKLPLSRAAFCAYSQTGRRRPTADAGLAAIVSLLTTTTQTVYMGHDSRRWSGSHRFIANNHHTDSVHGSWHGNQTDWRQNNEKQKINIKSQQETVMDLSDDMNGNKLEWRLLVTGYHNAHLSHQQLSFLLLISNNNNTVLNGPSFC